MIARASLLLALSSVAHGALAQAADSASSPIDVGGAVTITTKGISTIPTFTLGKPAAIFDLSVARRGLSFEPQLKFALDGKPWSFAFWGRYTLLEGEKFHLSVGAHPALSFRTTSISTNGKVSDLIEVRRYFAGEVNPSYALTKHVRIGTYYLYSHGIDRDAARHTNFLSLRANLTTAMLPGQLVARVAPQLYYLRQDERDGFYVNSGLTLSRAKFPLSLSTTLNNTIRSTVIQSDDVLWNVSLSYAID